MLATMADNRGKTGSRGREWITLERPRPPRVQDMERYWLEPPPQWSESCLYWIRQMCQGWVPNRRLRKEGRDAAGWFGVYVWEWDHVLQPMISDIDRGPVAPG